MDGATHTEMLRARDYILAVLEHEAAKRSDAPGLSWVENERLAVVRAANEWALGHNCPHLVTEAMVERVEGLAIGHADYAIKLALYTAELIYGVHRRP